MAELPEDLGLVGLLKREGVLGSPIDVGRGQRLIQPGETERHIYFIESGAFKIFFEHGDEEYITRLAYSDELITSLDSFITGEPTTYYIEALRSSVIRKGRVEAYRSFIKSSPQLHDVWNTLLSNLVFQQMEREVDLLIPAPQERYERVLKRSPKLFQEVPLKYIASYLRMTPETLSRVMKS